MQRWPRYAVFFDTETKSSKDPLDAKTTIESLRLGVVRLVLYTNGNACPESEHRFRTADEFWTILSGWLTRYREVWTFCHNSAFDWAATGLLERFYTGDLTLEPPPQTDPESHGTKGMFTIEGLPFMVRCWTRDGARLLGLDTLNWWRTSLSKLGENVKTPKLKQPKRSASDAVWFKYCRRDVEITVRAVSKFIKWCNDEKLKSFPLTTPSTAMMLWRTRYKPKTYRSHNDPEVRKIERNCYYGGRVWPRFLKPIKTIVHEYDVTSLYPSVMRCNRYPVRLIGIIEKPIIREDMTADGLMATCGLAKLNAKKHEYPIRTKNGIWYCRGRFETWLAGPELLAAYQRGDLVSVSRRSTYRLMDYFTPWVDEWSNRREVAKLNNDDFESTHCKLMSNSLYGKFGQAAPDFEYSHSDPTGNLHENIVTHDYGENQETHEWRYGPMVFVKPENTEIEKAWPAIAAWVTSYGRVRMDTLRDIAGWDNWFYQATDSLMVSADGHKRLVASGETATSQIGKLSHKNEYRNAHFRGPNYYSVGKIFKAGSVRREATDLAIKAKRVAKDTYRQVHFEGLLQILTRGPDGTVRVREVDKHMKGGFARGRVDGAGNVTPLTLDAWDAPDIEAAIRSALPDADP